MGLIETDFEIFNEGDNGLDVANSVVGKTGTDFLAFRLNSP